jgi:hypothetical protein
MTTLKIKLTLLVCTLFVFASAGVLGRVVLADNLASVHGAGEHNGILLTLSAVVKSDGETSGQAMFHDRNTNSKLSIDVDKIEFLISDRTARISGEVTRSTGSYAQTFPVGDKVVFAVEDNGEGADALPDEFSNPERKQTNLPADNNGGALLPVSDHGNIQVTGGEK